MRLSKSLESLSDFCPPTNQQHLPPPRSRVRDLESIQPSNASPRRMSDLPPRRILANLRPPLLPKPKAQKDRLEEVPRPTFGGSDRSPGERGAGQRAAGDSDIQRKIKEVEERVHGVTTEESREALRAHSGDVMRAVQALKMEQLYNVSRHTKDECRRILEKCHWDLEAASRYVLRRAHLQ
ncbi:non-receptor tyrosine-protein kinase TNK1-like [Rhinophrynus dorsalis]